MLSGGAQIAAAAEDRKGYKWVYRGPHTGGSPGFGMQWYYPMAAGFHTPGLTTQPA